MSKAKKGKGKTRSKNAKNDKTCRGARQRIDSFQNYSSRRLLMFLYKAGTCIKKMKLLF